MKKTFWVAIPNLAHLIIKLRSYSFIEILTYSNILFLFQLIAIKSLTFQEKLLWRNQISRVCLSFYSFMPNFNFDFQNLFFAINLRPEISLFCGQANFFSDSLNSRILIKELQVTSSLSNFRHELSIFPAKDRFTDLKVKKWAKFCPRLRQYR